MVSADMGDFGPTDGKPVIYNYHLLYHMQGIIPWLLLPLAFVALKENRNPHATWILAPIATLGLIYLAVLRILHMDSGSIVQFNVMFTIMVVGFALVWLLAERIGNRNRFITFLFACLIYFGFLGVNLLGSGVGEDIIAIASLAAVSIPAIIFAFIVAAIKSRKSFNTTRFVIYYGVALFSLLLITFALIMFIFHPSQNRPTTGQIIELLIASSLSSLIYFAAILPFVVLLFANTFWRKRFEAVSGIQIGEMGQAVTDREYLSIQ